MFEVFLIILLLLTLLCLLLMLLKELFLLVQNILDILGFNLFDRIINKFKLKDE